MIKEFLDGHLPCCDCKWSVHRVRSDLRAALGHLLVVLRANAVIAEPPLGTTPVDIELRRFDDHMNHVCGLAPKTRSQYLRIVRGLLIQQFANRTVTIPSIEPDDVRRF